MFIYAHEKIGAWVESGLVAEIDTGSNEQGDFFDVATAAVQFNSKTYAVPLAVKSLVLYTNDTLVSQPPTETDDFFRLAETLPEDVVHRPMPQPMHISHAVALWLWWWFLRRQWKQYL